MLFRSRRGVVADELKSRRDSIEQQLAYAGMSETDYLESEGQTLDEFEADPTTGELELEERHSLRRVAGLSTELTDVTEVEYRRLRLERVVLVGVWTSGTSTQANASLHELARLAETAGSQVLDGLVQRDRKSVV